MQCCQTYGNVTRYGDFTPNWRFSKSFSSRISPIGAWRKGWRISDITLATPGIWPILFSDISEWNNDYSDTFDFRRGWVGELGVVTFFVLKVPDYKSAMLIYFIYIYSHICIKLSLHDAWYVFVVRHVWMCQKDSSNLTHTVCFDVSIYRPSGKPDERMTHLLKLDAFFHTHDVRIMTHDASRIRTTHHVDLA